MDRILQERLDYNVDNYKCEIYVVWDDHSENVIDSLHEHFITDDQDMEVYLFCHRHRLTEKDRREWPSNFTFHFSSTISDNSLQTSMIVYVLEKFTKISDGLKVQEAKTTAKIKIFFIQKVINQFEELKSMLLRLPFISEMFTFKLLLPTSLNGSDFLFQAFKGHNQSRTKSKKLHNGLERTTSEGNTINKKAKILFGRRASTFETGRSPDALRKAPMKGASQHTCHHCDRRKGSIASFNNNVNNYFCLACYLHREEENDDLCRNCARPKYTETSDKSTSVDPLFVLKNTSIQCNLTDGKRCMIDVSTNMSNTMTKSVACQSEHAEGSEDLHAKSPYLMCNIDVHQDYLGTDFANIDRLKSGYRLNEIPKNQTTNKYHCPYCLTKSFGRQEIFEVHLKNVHKKCNCSCDRYFESREDYIDHFYQVFPLHCFESRKCPERFRTIHYQAIHHSNVHHSQKPFYCVPCYDVDKTTKVAFRNVTNLQGHGNNMEHSSEDMFLSVAVSDENEKIPFSARSTAINYSG